MESFPADPLKPGPGETLDVMRGLQLRFLQPAQGYRFSLDPFLLRRLLQVKPGVRAVDLGAGCGVLSVLLARWYAIGEVTAMEKDAVLAALAKRNASLNGVQEQMAVWQGDVCDVRGYWPPQGYQLTVANPPYRPQGSGRNSPCCQRAQARHEVGAELRHFVAASAYLLANGGDSYWVFWAQRLGELIGLLQAYNLEPKRLCCVHSSPDKPARMVLLQARRQGRVGLKVEPPLITHEPQGYSRAMRQLLAEADT